MSYEILLDSLNQIEHDQSLLETQLGTELEGLTHEELVKLGSKFVKKLKMFIDMGKQFVDQQQSDFLSKLIDAVQEYENLLLPPKVFGGICPCLKTARSGPEYDRKYWIARAKVVAATFLVHVVIIDSKIEKLNIDSMHFVDYTNKCTSVFNALSAVSTKGDETARENAKTELIKGVNLVNKFLTSFEDEIADFKGEAKRRISSTTELLSSRSSGESIPISRRILVKAQSTLQEIMNSASLVSMGKAKEALVLLDSLAKELRDARTGQVDEFNSSEKRIQESNAGEVLASLREDTETMFRNSDSRLRDSVKRWSGVKAQSSPRPVAEYRDEPAISLPSMPTMSGFPTPGGDPQKMLEKTGKTITSVGKQITNLPTKAAKGGGKAVMGAVSFTVNNAQSAVDKLESGAKKAGQLLGLEESPKKLPSKPAGAGSGFNFGASLGLPGSAGSGSGGSGASFLKSAFDL